MTGEGYDIHIDNCTLKYVAWFAMLFVLPSSLTCLILICSDWKGSINQESASGVSVIGTEPCEFGPLSSCLPLGACLI